MAETIKKTRIQFANDTVINWEAKEDTFQTLKGELYFYNDAINTGKVNSAGKIIYKPKLKIGNEDVLSKLNFFCEEYITNNQIDTLFSSNSNSNILEQATLDSLILG